MRADSKLPEFRDRIITQWRRFSTGLWRVPEGDIAAAYSGDQFPKLKTFVEGGQLYTTTGIGFLGDGVEATCHPLFSAGLVEIATKPYSSEGKVGTCKGKSWTLGPKVTFVSEDPPVGEWQKILRAQFADGGYFARQKTYSDFLASLQGKKTPNTRAALKCEEAGEFLKHSKAEMAHLLDSSAQTSENSGQQLPLL